MRLIQFKKPGMRESPVAFGLNMRNSQLTKNSGDYLFKAISNEGYYLTGLSLKFCFLTFENCLQLADALRYNKHLVKLDLSNNALKSCTVRFILNEVAINVSIS